MKYTLTLVLLVLLCSCTHEEAQLPVGEEVVDIPHTAVIYKFTFEGHDYLYGSYYGSMIHSASCKAPNHYEK